MKVHVLGDVARELKEMEFRSLADFNGGCIGIFRTSAGVSPWERHPNDEEMLHVINGEVRLIVIEKGVHNSVHMTAGSVFVVPRGLWHRHVIEKNLVELFVSPAETEHSSAEDPTRETT